MRTKVIMSLLVLALAGALVGGATFAYFTSEATNSGNVFSTGTLAISITDPVEEVMFNVPNMKPGDQVSDTITIQNTGSLNFKFRGEVTGNNYLAGGTFVVPGSAGCLSDVLNVVVTLIDTNGTPRSDVIFTGTLSQLMASGLPAWAPPGVTEPFQPDWTATYQVDITFNENADNDYQGSSFENGVITFTATQWDNPGWTE